MFTLSEIWNEFVLATSLAFYPEIKARTNKLLYFSTEYTYRI